MKKLTSLLAVTLLAVPLISHSQVSTVFNDTFSSSPLSSLNPSAASLGTALTASSTAYCIGSSKSANTSTLVSGALTLGPISTSSGYIEASAMFTGSPITLNTPGQYVELYYTFTDTANNFNGSGNINEQLVLGLYDSGGSPPTNGTALWSSGLSSSVSTAVTGAAQNWNGYTGYIAYSSTTAEPSAIETRPAQTGANNLNQALGYTSGFATPAGSQIKSVAGTIGQPTLTVGDQYTLALQLTYVNATTLTCTVTLYNGVGIGGSVYSSSGYTATVSGNTTSAQDITDTFDAIEVGFRPTGTSSSIANSLKVNNVTVITGTPIAPAITGLTNEIVIAGTSPTLSPTVTGVPTPVYQWQTNGVNIGSATNATLPLPNVQYAQNALQYSLIASNSLGSITNTMTLSVIVTPSITGLNNQSATIGNTVTISPTVSGIPTPDCQWQTTNSLGQMVNLTDGTDANGSIIAGSLTSTLNITNVQIADSATYWLVAGNSAGMVTNSMTLTVAAGNILPSITGPANVTAIQGNNATFSASASGVPVPTLQWLDQTGTPILNATNDTLTLTDVQYSQNGYTYSIVASNSVGSVTNSATLTVEVPPTITSQPVSVVVTNTQSASFTVGATGAPGVAYQWYQGTNAISLAGNSSANSATLVIASAVAGNIGAYYVAITNQVGVTNSVTVSLTVNSTTITPTAMSPANGATGICYDTPLSITFNQTPGIGNTGQIRIYNVTNSATPIEIIDLSSNSTSGLQSRALFPGDNNSFNYYPVVVNGNTANIYPHSGDLMTSNQTYYVTIGEGVFTDPTGAYFPGITATNTWQFTTKPGGPVDPVNPVVNANGSADFVTVQGALDSLATNAASIRRTITIAPGFYFEIVDDSAKTNVTLRGQSRTGSVIYYPNNATIAVGGSTHDRMTFKVNANDLALDNLTISNSTPQGGSQAEALMVETSAKRCIVNNCEVASRQDTVLANVNSSQAFFYNSTVDGNFDYIWGGGNLFFLKCILHTISGETGGNLTAARTDTASSSSTNTPWANPNGTTYSANGMSFVSCLLEADLGISTTTLGDGNGTAGGLASWAYCEINSNIYIPPAGTLSNSYVFWQFQNTDTNGVNPVTFTNVQFIGITNNDPRVLAVTNIQTWLYGWTPALMPNIVSQPVGATVTAGQSASFCVGATGIPDPTYQWQQNGAPLPGATSATLNITSAVRTNGGNYSVVVSNGSGSVTSSVAILTYSNTPPVATPASYTRNAAVDQLNISVTNLLSNVTDVDGDAISLVSVGVSTNGVTPVINGNDVVYYNTNAVNDQFAYTVTDGYGGTDSSVVNITVSNQPLFGQGSPGISSSGGSVTLNYAGIPGYSYSVERSTNVSFSPFDIVLTTNAPSGGAFQFVDPNPPQPTAFYRLQYNP